jgi:amino acid permease
MSKASEWKRQAEAEDWKAQRNYEDDVRFIFHINVFYLIILIILCVVIYIGKWLIMGGDFLPDNWWTATWEAVAILSVVPFMYVTDRWEKAKEFREQRIIRLETKIEELLDEQERLEI